MLTPGTIVAGDFRIERALSEGGMGAVYVAEQLSTGAMRALKVIRAELLHQQKLRQRFEQEAKVTSKIASDHVVSVVAAGIDSKLEIPWIAMELLQGQTLAQAVHDRGPLDYESALGILTQLAHAIDAAHAVGVVHRDLKPENIFLAESRRSGVPYFVKVLDFGIARVIREAQGSHTDSLGTPLWMAPEQAGSGESVGPRTDIWSIGLIVFFLLTGKSYWLSAREEGTALSIIKEVCLNPLAPASERAKELGASVELPPAFDAWFAECVARDSTARFSSAGLALVKLREALGAPSLQISAGGITPAGGVGGALPEAKTELALTPDLAFDSKDVRSAPSATPPHAIETTQRSLDAPPPPQPKKRSRVIAFVVLAVALVVGGFAVRAAGHMKDERACIDTRAEEPCSRACALGKSEACAIVGEREAFPLVGGVSRNQIDAVTSLKRACLGGYGCGTLGVVSELGWLESNHESSGAGASDYFEKACDESAAHGGAHDDCAWSVAHALEGPGNRDLAEPWKTRAAAIDLAGACNRDPDACGLAWMPKLEKATKEIRAAYEKGCAAGSSLACNNLGTLYAEGAAGLDANPSLARDRFDTACNAGEAAGCNNAAIVLGGFAATPRVGPRGAITYKLRCAGPFHVGCAAWGETVHPVPAGTPVNASEAGALFDRACTMESRTACVNLGALAYVGKGVASDRARAEKLFANTCFKGDPGACGEQGSALLSVRMDHPRDVRAGFGFMQRACKGGEEDACTVVYALLIDGLPEPKREAEGVAGMKRLAEAQIYSHEIALMYETGAEGVPRDPARARKMALALCDKDFSCSDAAYYFGKGIGGSKDEGRALEWLTKGCDHDDLVSCTELGGAYMDGRYVGKDPTRAVTLFQKACTEGEWDGCERLAAAYATGDGVAKDSARALTLAREACASGHAGGCARVGLMLAEGEGAQRDVDAAVPYLAFACRRAAMKSCAKLSELKKPVPELDP